MKLKAGFKLILLGVTMFVTTQPHSRAFFYKKPKHQDIIQTFNTGANQDFLDEDGKINLLVWNMYKGQNETWEKDFKKLSNNTHLLITQEMYLRDKMKHVFSNHGDFEYTTATSFYMKKKFPTGVATISRSPSSSKRYSVTRNKEPIIMTPKVALITTHDLSNGESLLSINIHAINFVPNKYLESQLNDLAFYAKWHQGPIIFAGDFNTWTKKKQKTLRHIMKSLSLKEVTYKSNDDHRMRFNGKVLDFIFYRGLKLESSSVLGHITGSDHKPLVASFSLN